MISFFRNMFKSKIGLFFTFAFIALIALAFAASDITGSTFGGVAGNDRVAVVGSERISTSTVTQTVNSAINQVRREQPTITMQGFVAQGGYDEVLDQLIDRYAIAEYARKYGLRAGSNLVNSEILQIPAFTGPSGNFDPNVYQAALRQQGLTDATIRRDLGDGLLAQMVLVPAIAAPEVPDALARQYASLLNERRRGSVLFIPSASFLPSGEPSAAQLQSFYEENRARYVRPERRVIRYTTFGAEGVTDRIEPTAAEIRARYERDAAQYAAQETRTISAFFVPTQDAANAIRARVQSGTNFAQAAREAGFSVTTQEDISKSGLAGLTSEAVANAVFSAPQGQIAQPARSPLGWYVARVDSITRIPARSLAQVSDELGDAIREEKRIAALNDLSARIEEEVDSGTSLSEVAESYGLTVESTPALLANGRVFNNPNQGVGDVLRPVLSTAFQMDESEPQLAELVRGERFIVFEVSEIVPSAAPQLAEVRAQVLNAWKLAEGSKRAKAAADRVLGRVKGNTTLAAAASADDAKLPAPEAISLDRRSLQAGPDGRVPPPLALLFSMAQGTTKRLEAGQDQGWYVIDLDEIEPIEVKKGDPLLAAISQQLRPVAADEYTRQLTRAMRNDVGVERNESAIEALRKALTGEN